MSVWMAAKGKPPISKKRTRCDDDDDDDSDGPKFDLSSMMKSGNITTENNHIYFNDDITQSSVFELCKQMRDLAKMLKLRSVNLEIEQQPLYLHISTNGGEISAAFTVVDCMKGLGIPVYSVVDGFVASAGTLITLAAHKRYISPNAYMLIHQLSSGVWGKMSMIEEQVSNMKKLMEHLVRFYKKHTTMKEGPLRRMLLTDVTWNAEESIAKGIADELYTSTASAPIVA